MQTIQEFYYWEMTTQDTIDVKKMYIDIADDLVAGILLSQIIFWNLPNKQGESKLRVFKEGKYWLAKRRDAWHDEIRISSKQYDRGIKILESLKLVEVKLFKFDGLPTPHICLNEVQLLNAINAMMQRNASNLTTPSDLPKGKNGNSPNVETGIDQARKQELTKEEKENSQNVKMGIDETEKSLTEITTKTTSEITAGVIETVASKWEQVQIILEKQFSKVSYNQWLKPLKLGKIEGDTITVIADSAFSKDIINTRYKPDIESAIEKVYDFGLALMVVSE